MLRILGLTNDTLRTIDAAVFVLIWQSLKIETIDVLFSVVSTA